MRQTIDGGLKREALESYLMQSGYWAGAERRRRNTYVLSPSMYVVSVGQREQLERLSRATYAAVQNLSTTLSKLADTKSLSNDEARFLALATNNTRGLLGPSRIRGAVPPAMKVDLVQDADGRYFIAEVDAYNPRGFGYMALLDGSVPEHMRSGQEGRGIAGLAKLMHKTDHYISREWLFIVSEFERYYEPSFQILVAALKKQGVPASVVQECDRNESEFAHTNVFCVPESMHQNVCARNYIATQWRYGSARLFYPPAAYLGSKAFLPFLRSQPGMAEFVPESMLVNKKSDPHAVMNGTPVVLKGVLSSGLKKVVFNDTEPERFAAEYAAARSTKNPQWLLQAQVPQEPTPIVVFNEKGDRITLDYFLRITAYVSAAGLLGAEVTGRTDRAVHGAPDCIQVPAIYA